jgi:hypothetical protein
MFRLRLSTACFLSLLEVYVFFGEVVKGFPVIQLRMPLLAQLLRDSPSQKPFSF